MEDIEHKNININGINMHIAEKGKGPTILFLHGFPELWYSWRHQILFFAENGYRAVAPDLRGFGETTGAPNDDPSKFTSLHLVGDLISLLDAVAADEEKVIVVGQDWGAIVGWWLCLFRPDRIKAFVTLGIHYLNRNPDPAPNIVDLSRSIYGDDHYIWRFQEPGDIEAEFAKVGVKQVLKKFLTFREPAPFRLPKTDNFLNSYSTPATLPDWLSDQDLNYFVSIYQKTGFTGGLNYYRSIKLDWELLIPWTNAKVTVPVKFIVGDLDLVYNVPLVKEYVHNGGFKKDVPLLDDEIVVMENVGHFINQEKPVETNNHIFKFIKKI